MVKDLLQVNVLQWVMGTCNDVSCFYSLSKMLVL